MFQRNSAVKQSEGLCRHSLEYAYGDFLAQELMWPRVFSCPFSGLRVSTRLFEEISICAIFVSVMLPFFYGGYILGKAFKSENR